MMIDGGCTSSYLPPLVIKLLAFIFSVLLSGRSLFLVVSGKGTLHLTRVTCQNQIPLPKTYSATEVFGWKKLKKYHTFALFDPSCPTYLQRNLRTDLSRVSFAVVGVAGHMDTRATIKDLGRWNHHPADGNPAFVTCCRILVAQYTRNQTSSMLPNSGEIWWFFQNVPKQRKNIYER